LLHLIEEALQVGLLDDVALVGAQLAVAGLGSQLLDQLVEGGFVVAVGEGQRGSSGEEVACTGGSYPVPLG
jgi:hypothetical protein